MAPTPQNIPKANGTIAIADPIKDHSARELGVRWPAAKGKIFLTLMLFLLIQLASEKIRPVAPSVGMRIIWIPVLKAPKKRTPNSTNGRIRFGSGSRRLRNHIAPSVASECSTGTTEVFTNLNSSP